MTSLLKYSLLTIFLFIISLSVLTSVLFSFISVLYANEILDRDYIPGYQKIETINGIDREIGRYLTYHYEFIE